MDPIIAAVITAGTTILVAVLVQKRVAVSDAKLKDAEALKSQAEAAKVLLELVTTSGSNLLDISRKMAEVYGNESNGMAVQERQLWQKLIAEKELDLDDAKHVIADLRKRLSHYEKKAGA